MDLGPYKHDLVCHLQIDEKSTPCQGFDLNVGMVSVHDRKKPVKCSFCSATFTQNSSLNRHVAQSPTSVVLTDQKRTVQILRAKTLRVHRQS